MLQFLPAVPAHDDIENLFFRHAQHLGQLLLLGVAGLGNFAGGGNQPPQGGFFGYDADVILHVGRRRHELGQLDQVFNTADAGQRAPAGQFRVHGHQVHRTVGGGKGLGRVEYFPMGGHVKIIGLEHFRGRGYRAAVLQHSAQHRAFRFGAVGRHGRKGRSSRRRVHVFLLRLRESIFRADYFSPPVTRTTIFALISGYSFTTTSVSPTVRMGSASSIFRLSTSTPCCSLRAWAISAPVTEPYSRP